MFRHRDYTKEIGKVIAPALRNGRIRVMDFADRRTFEKLYEDLVQLGFPELPFQASREIFSLGMVSREALFRLISVNVELCKIGPSDQCQLWNGAGRRLQYSSFNFGRETVQYYAMLGQKIGRYAFIKLDITSIFPELRGFLESA